YSAHAAIELYAEAFDEAKALDRLEAFASFNGPDFYRLPRNQGTITLKKDPWKVAATLPLGGNGGEDDELVPLRAGEQIAWRLV
ncbi:MAG: dihydroorotase, partial [Proteobacteria bacterium]|nr:dihydroorotase [Pseudomonadota bacterium]